MYSDLVGNGNIAEALRRMAKSRRIPQSMLFAGPEGIGKKQFAIEFARTLVCRSSPDGEACGDCSACRRAGEFDIPKSDKAEDFDRVFLSHHPDIGLVCSPKRLIRVGAIRALETEANFRPVEAENRVFIIDDADKMNPEAANALLKTLEEPPANVYLVLVTARPDALLQTIRSRCQMLRFAPVATAEICDLLVSKHGQQPDDAALASRLCGGSIAAAIEFDAAAFRSERAVCLEVLKSSISENGLYALLEASEALTDTKARDRFENGLKTLLTLKRDAIAIRAGAGPDQIVNFDVADELAEIANALPSSILAQRVWAIEDLLKNQEVNINRKVALDGLFTKMANDV